MRKSIALVVSLFLVFSILNLQAKERKGAEVIISTKDGLDVRGELIAVKESSLLLMEKDSGVDIAVDIGHVNVITIEKNSKLLLGAGIGASVGVVFGSGYIIFTHSDSHWLWERAKNAGLVGAAGAGIGALIGGIVGAAMSGNERIQITQKTSAEIKEILKKLRKKARVPDYN